MDNLSTMRRLYMAAYSETHDSGMDGLQAACREMVTQRYKTGYDWAEMEAVQNEAVSQSQLNNLIGWVM